MSEGLLKPADENPLAAKLRELLGAGDYEEVRIVTPQFDRTDGRKVYYYPKTAEEFDKLKEAPHDILIDMGLGVWSKDNGQCHYLYPHEWYAFIPDDYEVFGLFGEAYKFKHGESDDDKRFGCLPYGFIKEAP